jgi:hypothetical protein
MSVARFRTLLAATVAAVGLWSTVAAAQPAATELPDPADELPVRTDRHALWSFGLSVAPGRAVDLEHVREGVAGVDVDGDRVWTLHHSFRGQVPMTRFSSAYRRPTFDPVVLGRTGYYATYADLVAVDLPTGRVVDRTRFPAVILGLERAGDELRVEIGSRNAHSDAEKPGPESRAWKEPWRLTIPYEPGSAAPQVVMSDPEATYTTVRDATLASRVAAGWDIRDGGDAFLRRRLMTLRARQLRDPTNPFFTTHRGLILELLGEKERATRAFRRAAGRATYHWTDSLRLAVELVGRVSMQRVEPILERGLRQMREAGIEQPHFSSLVWVAVFARRSGGYRRAIRSALQEGEVERVDRLAGGMARMFPHGEMANLAYAKYARWFEHQGAPELAETWRERARRAADSMPYRVIYRASRHADLAILAAVTSLLALFLLPLIIGMRVGRTAADREDDERGLFQRLGGAARWTDLAGVLLVGATLVGAVQYGSTSARTVHLGSDAALDVVDAAFWTPSAITWFEQLEPSDARDEWLAYARDQRKALTDGREADADPPPPARLADAIWQTASARSTGAEDLTSEAPNFPGAEWLKVQSPVAAVAAFGSTLAGGLAIGLALGFLLPGLFSPWARWLVPGAAPRAGLLAAPILLATVAAALALTTPLDQLIFELSRGAFDKYYHIDAVDISVGPSHGWAWGMLAVGLLLHLATNLLGDHGGR